MLSSALWIALALTGLLAFAYLALALVVAQRFTTAGRARPCSGDAAEESTGLARGVPVRFLSRDGHAVIAGVYLPALDAAGAVVVVHGKDADKADALGGTIDPLLARLADERFSVLLVDLRGHGESTGGRLTYGANERFDVLGAVDWLRERGYEPGRIGVMGASMGGAAVIAAAAEEQAIGAVVADSAFADFGAVLRHNFPRVMPLPGALAVLAGALAIAQTLTGVSLGRFAPAEHAAQLGSRGLLVIHAEGDRFITPDHAERIAGAAGSVAWITPGEGHVASFRNDPIGYSERVTAFLVAHLAQRG